MNRMSQGGSRKFLFLAAAALGIAAVLLFLVSAPQHPQATSGNSKTSNEATPPPAPAAASPAEQVAADTTPQSAEELAQFIRRYAQTGSDPAGLYRLLGAVRLSEQPWWRNGRDVSALFDLASDATLDESYRVVAMGVYLAAAPQPQLDENSTAVQKVASAGSDSLVSTALQGMAERQVAPEQLISQTLHDPQRGDNAKCLAWYAARLTRPADPNLVAQAVIAAAEGATISTKTGLDYVASTAMQATPHQDLAGAVDKLLGSVISLPKEADAIEVANADAFVQALPNLTEQDDIEAVLMSVLHNTPHPEIRIAALEQLVKLHNSDPVRMSVEIASIRKNLSTLFPDAATEIRAEARLRSAAP